MSAPGPELKLASTVLLVRDRPRGGVEVFMERRHVQSGFVGGAYVFPGGRVDPEDAIDAARCAGLDEATANRMLGRSNGGLAHYVAAIRECFEEAGVLLAYDRSGALLDFSNRDLAVHYDQLRARLNAGELTIGHLTEQEDLRLATDRIAYWAHWITPIGEPRRYDTRFFVTHAPEGQAAVHDDWELTHSAWVAPDDAIARAANGEWMIIFPTLVNLKSLSAHATADDAVRWARRQSLPLPANQPKLFGGRVVLPGDPGYEQADDDLTNVDRRAFDRSFFS